MKREVRSSCLVCRTWLFFSGSSLNLSINLTSSSTAFLVLSSASSRDSIFSLRAIRHHPPVYLTMDRERYLYRSSVALRRILLTNVRSVCIGMVAERIFSLLSFYCKDLSIVRLSDTSYKTLFSLGQHPVQDKRL